MRIMSIAVLALVAAGSLAAEEASAPKKRIAVFDFDSAAIQGGMTSVFFQTSAPNTGKAVADLILTRLVKAGNVVVIERAAIDKLIAEQNLSNSDRADPATAARIGRVLGVDGIVLGTITKWDYTDKTTGGGGARFGGFGGVSMKTKHDIKARVEITARLASPDTAEVLFVAQGSGEIFRKGVKVDMRDSSQYSQMMSGGYGNPVMSEALDQAIAQLTDQLEQKFTTLPRHVPVIEGLIADANESGRLVLNVGSASGLKQGDVLQVWRPGKEIRDPGTQKLLMRDDLLLGEALVNTVAESYAIAAYKGNEKVRIGDVVKSVPKR